MLRRFAILALVVQQFVWLNLIIPGHIRGQYTLDGTSAAGRPNCCSSDAGGSSHRHSDSSRPTPAERSHCAVCFYAVGTWAAPPVLCEPAPLGLLMLLDAPAPRSAPSADLPPAYYGRAPPAA